MKTKKLIIGGSLLSALSIITASVSIQLKKQSIHTTSSVKQYSSQSKPNAPTQFETVVELNPTEIANETSKVEASLAAPYQKISLDANEPAREIIAKLTSLANGKNSKAFSDALERVFLGPDFQNQRAELYQAALSSPERSIRNIAQALSFLDSVEERGFNDALSSAEEELFENSDENDFLDFLVEEAATQNPAETLSWLNEQSPELWRDAIPLILADWAGQSPAEVGAWIQSVDSGPFRDRAIAEYVPVLAQNGQGFSENLVAQIQDEDVQQEARIRTGELDFSILGSN